MHYIPGSVIPVDLCIIIRFGDGRKPMHLYGSVIPVDRCIIIIIYIKGSVIPVDLYI